MVHGNISLLLRTLGAIWSILLQGISPLFRLISSTFREREETIDVQIIHRTPKPEQQSLWIHASSLGEFEQARSIIEGIKENALDFDITVSFFSPSGYRIRNTYDGADRVVYLPLDTIKNVRTFLDEIKPDLIIFIRYELWLNYLLEARIRSIPCYVVNATFPRSMMWMFAKPILKSILELFSEIYTVGENEQFRFEKLRLSIPVHAGTDTRIDRIYQQVIHMKKNKGLIEELLPGLHQYSLPCIVLGSTWTEDEHMFVEALNYVSQPVRLIIVPHEPDSAHCLNLKEILPHSILQSECYAIGNEHVIIDSIGKLLAVYAIADAAYIGGGFGAGVHSCAEPAGYGIPLACGPFIKRSPDAQLLQHEGALEVISNAKQAASWMNAVCAGAMSKAGESAAKYIDSRRGMTQIILQEIIGLK